MTRRPVLSEQSLYLTERDPQRAVRMRWSDWKVAGRAELRQLNPTPRFIGTTDNDDFFVRFGQRHERALRGMQPPPSRTVVRGPGAAADDGGPPDKKAKLEDPTCLTRFDAVSKVTTITATAKIRTPVGNLAGCIDPRGWGLSNGVIDVAFPVIEKNNTYVPFDDLKVRLGTPWKGLLFEYARSEIASFENILQIHKFEKPERRGEVVGLHVEYRLYDCLKTIIGFLGVDGGLQRNDGSVTVTPDPHHPRDRSIFTVVKNIRVRDLTPNDPGNRYDFGQAINSTMGAALSAWVDDVSMMSPVF